jgi:hypothetical protein
MGVESDLDRLAFLSVEEFGLEVTLHPNSNPRKATAIFDNGHFEISDNISVISTTQPSLVMRTKDITDLEQDDEIEVDGVIYTVADIQSDGTGMTMVRIHKA